MPDPTDNYALVPHRLEELHNVDGGTVSVGDVLTVSAVDGGVPTWEAAGATGASWQRLTLSDTPGDWMYVTDDSPVTLDGTYLPVINGDQIYGVGGVAVTGPGVAIVESSRRHEARVTVRVRRSNLTGLPDGSSACMMYGTDGLSRSIYWQWYTFADSTQLYVADTWGQGAWISVDAATDWVTVVATLRVPDYRPGFTVTFDDEFGSTLPPDPTADEFDGIKVWFSSGNPDTLVDLGATYIDVRAI